MSVEHSSDKQMFWQSNEEDRRTKLSGYQFTCIQNKVSGSGKISNLHCMLEGAAFQFFIHEIEGKDTNFCEAVRCFGEGYASAARQDYISVRLNELHISQFEFNFEIKETLARLNPWE